MAQQIGPAADWPRPVGEHIRADVPGCGYVRVNETAIEYLVPGNGETKLGHLWTCARPSGETVFTGHPRIRRV